MDLLLKRPALTLAVGISLAYAAGLLALFIFNDAFGMDFGVYWRVSGESVEAVYEPRAALNFPYAPTMLLWISPLAFVPRWLALAIWTLVSVWVAFGICLRHLSALGAALVLISPPMFYAILNGQVTVGLTALLLWACGHKNRMVAGLMFAVIASIKPHLVIMAPLFLVSMRDWDALIAAILGYVVLACTSIVAYGIEPWFAWVGSFDHFHHILHKNGVLAVAATPAGVAERFGLPGFPFLIGGALFGAWAVIRWRGYHPLQHAAAIAAASLLAAPYAVTYDLAPIVPFLVHAVLQGRIAAAAAMSSALSPLPLLLTVYEMATRRRDENRRLAYLATKD